jgi:hypothetical protein
MPTAAAPAAPPPQAVNATSVHVEQLGQLIESIRVHTNPGVRTRISILVHGLLNLEDEGADEDTPQFVTLEITG